MYYRSVGDILSVRNNIGEIFQAELTFLLQSLAIVDERLGKHLVLK